MSEPILRRWRDINRANWEARVPIHTGVGGYDLAAFADPTYLTDDVRFDLPRLGRLDGLDVAHLQCHIGTDTVSLARLGARSVTGLDFAPAAVAAAQTLASAAVGGERVRFVEADLYDAVSVLGHEQRDLVYTGIGALCWLPSIERWASVVGGLLRPGGRLFMREGHPMLFALADPRPDGLLVVEYPYFETEGFVYHDVKTYAGCGTVASPTTVQFNHGLGEVIGALLRAGLTLTALEEHREVPWNPLGAAMTPSPHHPGEYVLKEGSDRLACTYTLQAVKPRR
jgi:SAM-dependent methyltransferase